MGWGVSSCRTVAYGGASNFVEKTGPSLRVWSALLVNIRRQTCLVVPKCIIPIGITTAVLHANLPHKGTQAEPRHSSQE